MNIGEVSSRSGVSQRMIRHYEKVELVPRAARRASGYRDYGDDDVHRLRFVRRARDLGFGIEEIRRLLALWEDRERSSAEVKALALTRAGELRRKEQEMASMRRTLEALARSCSGNERPDCPILDDLAAADGA
jgi:Cu(I)-responsive transcriptional regulator